MAKETLFNYLYSKLNQREDYFPPFGYFNFLHNSSILCMSPDWI